jgi:ABC-2 type transport system permease protein
MVVAALAQRELVRFLRQRSRVVGALLTPVIFWLVIGVGVGRTFNAPGHEGGYSTYFFPGMILMVVLFTAIFSTISLIEDRRDGFLQGVLVAPVSRLSILLGKAAGCSVLAVGQALLLMALAPLAGISLSIESVGLIVVALSTVAVSMSGLGLLIAWPMSSTQGFHAIMNVLLMPMWLVSGALFPLRDDMSLPMRVLMQLNPMTYMLGLVRHAMFWDDAALRATLPTVGLCLGVTVGVGVVFFVLTARMASRVK